MEELLLDDETQGSPRIFHMYEFELELLELDGIITSL
jgi:hypothetical protein